MVPASRVMPVVSLLLSLCALMLTFSGLSEWDVPLTRFVRSLNDVQVDHLANPWLAQLSDFGDRLGKGDSLVILSLILLAVGFGLRQPQWKDAGWQTLIAHGLAALSANMLKQMIGRARPKFMHAGIEFSPIGGSGWDSFPSGHAAASIAVATVLAVKFPRVRWPVLALAVAIGASRIFRGSHYLTDVAGGAALGCVMGIIAAHPLREWRASAGVAVCRMTPFFVAALTLIWTMVQLPSVSWPFQQLVWSGALLTLVGLLGHVLKRAGSVRLPAWVSGHLIRGMVGLGLGMTTGSLFVTAVVWLVCMAHWLDGLHESSEPVTHHHEGIWAAMAEGLFVAAMLLLLVVSYALKGIVPM